jgi:hypothetical protein
MLSSSSHIAQLMAQSSNIERRNEEVDTGPCPARLEGKRPGCDKEEQGEKSRQG